MVILLFITVAVGLLLIGRGERARAGARRADPWRAAALASLATAVAALSIIGVGQGDLDRYRVSLLGYRFALADTTGRPLDRSLVLGGRRDSVDVYVPGAGASPAAEFRVLGTDSVESVVLEALEDASALTLVFVEDRWRVLGAQSLTSADTLVVRTATGIVRVQPVERSALGITTHDLSVMSALRDTSVHLPLMERARRFVKTGRTVFRRTYPLSDVLEQAFPEQGGGWSNLSSVLYYDDNTLLIVDVDSEVDLVGPGSGERASLRRGVSIASEGRRRFRLAALPFTDFPELRLTLPERYGIRPLRSMIARRQGAWLDLYLDVPEAYALTRPELAALNESQDRYRTDAYRIRVTPAARAVFRRSLALDLPAGRFAVTSPAILELPRPSNHQHIGVLTPAGRFEALRGVPFPVGEKSDRSLILRVDRQATSLWFWMALLGILALSVAPFVLMARAGRTRHRGEPLLAALVVIVHGLLVLRLIVSMSAFATPPFSDESYELALWLLPFGPWAILMSGLLAVHAIGNPEEADRPRRLGLLALGLCSAVVPLVILRGSFRGIVLALLPLVIACLALLSWYGRNLARAGRNAITGLTWRASALELLKLTRSAPWWLGILIGGLFLGVRLVGAVLGFREMIPIPGDVRLGIGVLYTPLVTLAFAWLLFFHMKRLGPASDRVASQHGVVSLIVSVGGFLALAYGGPSKVVSDWGIALAGLVGPLSLLALLACLPRVVSRVGRVGAAALVIPLALFVAVQVSPRILPVVYPLSGSEEDLRMTLWERDELLLLERGDPEQLRLIGQRRSEAIAVMRETLKSYTQANWNGLGFFRGNVSSEIRPTATQEHTTTALLAGEWGVFGPLSLLGLLVLLLVPGAWGLSSRRGSAGRARVGRALAVFAVTFLVAVLLGWFSPWLLLGGMVVTAISLLWMLSRHSTQEASAEPELGPPDEVPPWPWFIAAAALLTFTGTGLYMILANYGFVFFTGKNVYLFGLDSVSDSLEALALLAIGASALVVTPVWGEEGS